jgi:hypothetical protein
MMTPDELVSAYMYCLTERLAVDDMGLLPGVDPLDIQAAGAGSILIYRLAARSQTPSDCALARLAVLTGSLLVAGRDLDGARIVRQWINALDEYESLQRAAN